MSIETTTKTKSSRGHTGDQSNPLSKNKDYLNFLQHLKGSISSAKIRAAKALNHEVIQMYWSIGKQIIEKQRESNWGDKFLANLSADLHLSFPDMRGFSKTNLKYMRIFAQLYSKPIGQQAVDQLPWGHITLLIRLKSSEERKWYAEEALNNGWSRQRLHEQIKIGLYKRQAIESNKSTNFLENLPSPQSQLAQELLKNPYNFDCLGLHDEANEREIERASVEHITKFLLELGKGFTFYGHQVPIEVSDKEFFIDMLFYHVKLHCYVVIELKATEFKPEHAGQLNFYLSAVDEKFKMLEDNPTIGILLCKSRDKIIAEYSLRDIKKPMGISEFNLTKAVPESLITELPTISEIELSLNRGELSDEQS